MEFYAKNAIYFKKGTETYKLGTKYINRNRRKNLGVILQDNLSPEKHINNDIWWHIHNTRKYKDDITS